jgi:RHS repeat-associated protein
VPAGYKFDRGFTGHEHLDDFGLINMNGRMYDPVLAMFLSPDPFIQSPETAQNFNRYAHVMNNPLKYTDPTGFRKSTYLETLMDMYNYEGGGFWYRGDYYSYYDGCGFVNSSGTALSSGNGYHYSWSSGDYQDSRGNVVPYIEVHFNFVLPKASEIIVVRSVWAGSRNDRFQYLRQLQFSNGQLFSWSVDNGKWVEENGKPFNPVNYFLSTYGKNPRVGPEYFDTDVFLGLSGTNNLMVVAADLSKFKIGQRFLRASGGFLSLLNSGSMIWDARLSGRNSWGDYTRAIYTAAFGFADFGIPFLGLGLGICDNFGLFEPIYHQMDVWQQTGYWVWYDMYKNEMRYKNLRK